LYVCSWVRKRQGSGHILCGHTRILIGDLGGRRAARRIAQHLLRRHPGAADHRLAAHHGGIDFDAGVGCGHERTMARKWVTVTGFCAMSSAYEGGATAKRVTMNSICGPA
jgi:hypothetical protein